MALPDEHETDSKRDLADALIARPGLFSVTRTGVLLILIGHLIACGLVFWLMPGGWPWISLEFAAYRMLPLVMAIFLVWSVIDSTGERSAIAISLLWSMWLSLAGLCIVAGSPSMRRLGVAALCAAMVLYLARKRGQTTRPIFVVLLFVAGFLFTLVPFKVIQSPVASTVPLGTSITLLTSPQPVHASVPLGKIARLDPTQASITFGVGKRFFQIEPLLTFNQRSPDATWTILASTRDRRPPVRNFIGVETSANEIAAQYVDQDDRPIATHVLRLQSESPGDFEIDASATLPKAIFSHLNTFTQVTLAGHKELRIAFSAIPGQTFLVTHAGYPGGSPARFAYVGADDRLHLVEATRGEKGPYHELGSGPTGNSLTITFLDGPEKLFELELLDWAGQASRQVSPAAGWGVPQNAIEFGLLSENPKSPASVFITLAATSVGRGWSSVGHTPGIYVNRLRVRLADNKQ